MIAVLEEIQDDELFASWFEAMMEKNGAVSRNEKYRYLYAITKNEEYAHSQRKFRSDYMPNIEEVCHALEGMPLFPSLEDILRKHTDLYAMMPFLSIGTQARRFEYCLHGLDSGNGVSRGGLKQTVRKICPLCAKEDRERHGRTVIHVPHTLHVDACWKHGCRLVNESEWKDGIEPATASDQEVQKAVFMHDLYLNPAITYFEQMRDALKASLKSSGISPREAIKRAAEDGYLDPHLHTSLFLKEGYDDSENYCRVYLAVLIWHYWNAYGFKNDLPIWNPADEYDRDEDMDLVSCNGSLARFRCKTCGHEFYMHPVSAEYGTPCTNCKKKMTNIQIMQRYADHLDDGQYDVTKDENGRIRVIHRECGRDCTDRFSRIVWSHIKCEQCRVKHEVESHIGERKMNGSGCWMEIVGGKSLSDLTIRFDSGEEVNGKSYHSFLNGTVKGGVDGRLKKDREGEETVNKWGDHMKLLHYRHSNDIDVVFDDCSIACNRNYASFLNGSIRKPEKPAEEQPDCNCN